MQSPPKHLYSPALHAHEAAGNMSKNVTKQYARLVYQFDILIDYLID